MASKGALYLRVKVRELFPPDDPIVPPILRLMAAVNDLRTLQKLWLYAETRVGETESEKEIIKAEHTYLFRLTCGTLYEAAIAFQDFKRALVDAEVLSTIENLPKYAQNAFRALDNVFREDFERREYGKVLVQMRNFVFHYAQPKVFRTELQKHDEQGDLIIGEIVGVSRYLFVDDLQVQITMRPLGVDIQDKLLALGRFVTEITGYLGELVDGTVELHMQSQENAIVEKREDSVDTDRLWRLPS